MTTDFVYETDAEDVVAETTHHGHAHNEHKHTDEPTVDVDSLSPEEKLEYFQKLAAQYAAMRAERDELAKALAAAKSSGSSRTRHPQELVDRILKNAVQAALDAPEVDFVTTEKSKKPQVRFTGTVLGNDGKAYHAALTFSVAVRGTGRVTA